MAKTVRWQVSLRNDNEIDVAKAINRQNLLYTAKRWGEAKGFWSMAWMVWGPHDQLTLVDGLVRWTGSGFINDLSYERDCR